MVTVISVVPSGMHCRFWIMIWWGRTVPGTFLCSSHHNSFHSVGHCEDSASGQVCLLQLCSFGGWKSEIKGLAGLVPSGGCEGESAPGLSPGFWWFAGDLWHSLSSAASSPSLPLSSHGVLSALVSLCPNFPLSYSTNHTGLGARPTPVQSHLT